MDHDVPHDDDNDDNDNDNDNEHDMKTASSALISAETTTPRQPTELIHIWREDNPADWYYTTGDVAVVYGGHTYTPAAISRSAVTHNDKLEVTEMSLDAAYLEDPALEFIAINPVEILWVSVSKVLRDMSPLEADVVFVGQIANVSFKGATARAKCVGFEQFLKMQIPTLRFQLGCNWHIFDDHCGLAAASYKTTATVTLDSTGTILTSATFGTLDAGYLNGGRLMFGTVPRTISLHEGSTITLVYKIPTLQDNDSVDVYPGCDGRAETCRDKYDNINHFLGFPFIPQDNPALRTP